MTTIFNSLQCKHKDQLIELCAPLKDPRIKIRKTKDARHNITIDTHTTIHNIVIESYMWKVEIFHSSKTRTCMKGLHGSSTTSGGVLGDVNLGCDLKCTTTKHIRNGQDLVEKMSFIPLLYGDIHKLQEIVVKVPVKKEEVISESKFISELPGIAGIFDTYIHSLNQYELQKHLQHTSAY